jgi:hypothetical protein
VLEQHALLGQLRDVRSCDAVLVTRVPVNRRVASINLVHPHVVDEEYEKIGRRGARRCRHRDDGAGAREAQQQQ